MCSVWNVKLKHINDVRFAMFKQKYAPKKEDEPLNSIRGINPSIMPPCLSVLQNKMYRTNYVASLWRNATLSKPDILKPEENGWLLDDGAYKVTWFDCDQIPSSLAAILTNGNTDVNDLPEDAPCDSDESEIEDNEFE